jgi:hypothetical protein
MAIARTHRCGTRFFRSSDRAGLPMKTEFNHPANDSPRSGSSKQVTPAVWAVIVAAIVIAAIWFATRT